MLSRLRRHPLTATLAIGLPFVAAAMIFSLYSHHLGGWRSWLTPTDFWWAVQGALYVANGALGYIYETDRALISLPLFPILLAPLAWLGQRLSLTTTLPFYLLRPTMWLLLGPFALATSIPLMHSVRRFSEQTERASRASRPGRTWVAELLVLGVVFVPISFPYGHFEDALAIACVLFAFRLVLRGRPAAAGLALGAAIAFKQIALLGLPLFVAAVPRGLRLRALAACMALPGVLAGFVLAVDWEHAAPNLLASVSHTVAGHVVPWIDADPPRSILAGPARSLALVVPMVMAVRLWGTRDPRQMLSALGLCLLARSWFEPVVHAYYLAPVLTMFLLRAHLERRVFPAGLLGAGLMAYFLWYPGQTVWWLGFIALSLALGALMARDVFRSRPVPVATALEGA